MEIKINGSSGLVSVQKAARELGVSRVALHEWVDGNKMVGINFDGILFIPASEVTRIKNDQQAMVVTNAHKRNKKD